MPLTPAAQRVSDALRLKGYAGDVLELAVSTRSAADAARAVDCDVARIVKSLVFRGASSGEPLLVLTSGSNRVDEAALGDRLGERLERADADFVREHTGFAIGGVPPLGHPNPLRTLIDRDLMSHETIWAAAGTPSALFEITPVDLARLTGGEILQVT
jgi:prolyl-tRNA editing enzyme YbaK/EbsC (Cys-tRNA(Pro) deacylase)